MRKLLLLAVVGVGAFLVSPRVLFPTSPSVGSKASEVLVTAQLRTLVEGTWVYADGSREITFRIAQSAIDPHSPRAERSFVSAAYACGDHTLIRSAAACLDTWKLPLDIEILAGVAVPAPLHGMLTVFAMKRLEGTLWLELGATTLEAHVGPDSITLDGASLRRVAPQPK